MSTLFLNGCSYAHAWKNADELSTRLGYDTTVNMGLPGSSNRRIFRTTMEYLTKNTVDFAVIMLSFFERYESPWGKERQL